MSLFTVDFERYIDNELPEIRRLPKWQGYMNSIIKPFAIWYVAFLGKRSKWLRRRYCDGSVIALESLVYLELGVLIEITDGSVSETGSAQISIRNEDTRCKINTRGEGTATMYIGTRGESLADTDYIVQIKSKFSETTRTEMIRRVTALIELYNSAGYNFEVKY